jgi:hypothetical protein
VEPMPSWRRSSCRSAIAALLIHGAGLAPARTSNAEEFSK